MAPCWSGGVVTVKNTFITLAPEDDLEEEVAMLQARKRRDAQSCPYFASPSELGYEHCPVLDTFLPEPTAELSSPLAVDMLDFQYEGSQLVNPRACRWASMTSERAEMDDFVTDGMRKRFEASPECPSGHSPVTTHEFQLLQSLLLDESPGGLLLTEMHIKSKSITACLDVMLDAPTPLNGGAQMDCSVHAHTSNFLLGCAPPLVSRTVSECTPPPMSRTASNPFPSGAPPVISRTLTDPTSTMVRRRGGGARGRGKQRLWCHIFLNPVMIAPGFDLVKKIIGKGGDNTRKIFDATQTKVRVRGRGSGHKEHNGREASVPLMIALAAEHGNAADFRNAFQMTKDLLSNVSQRFLRHQKSEPRPVDRLFWVGDISKQSQDELDGLVDDMLPESLPEFPRL